MSKKKEQIWGRLYNQLNRYSTSTTSTGCSAGRACRGSRADDQLGNLHFQLHSQPWGRLWTQLRRPLFWQLRVTLSRPLQEELEELEV